MLNVVIIVEVVDVVKVVDDADASNAVVVEVLLHLLVVGAPASLHLSPLVCCHAHL
jgi:hypothetical protein